MAWRWAMGRRTSKEESDKVSLWIESVRKDRYGFVKIKYVKRARSGFEIGREWWGGQR